MGFWWTGSAIKRLVSLTLNGEDAGAIAARLGCIRRTVVNMQAELGLIERQAHRPWSRKEIALVVRTYADRDSTEIAVELECSVGRVYRLARKLRLRKSPELLAAQARKYLPTAGAAFRFKPGQAPSNKGLRRPGWSPGRMSETQFKKGEKPHTWKPLWSIRSDADGYMQMKVSDTGYPPHDWVGCHILLWEDKHGPVPPGHAVVFKDGNKAHVVLSNLELISRAELMRRNTIHKLPPALKSTIMLRGVLRRKIREAYERQNDGSTPAPVRRVRSSRGQRKPDGA